MEKGIEPLSISDGELRRMVVLHRDLIELGIKNVQELVGSVATLAGTIKTMLGTQAKLKEIQDNQITAIEAALRTIENLHGMVELLRTASELHTTALKGFERSEAAIGRRLQALEAAAGFQPE